jgi:hypothetical protein
VKRVIRWVLWYLSIGVAVGIEEGAHQAARFDPGFDPSVAAAVTVFVWPPVLLSDLAYLMASPENRAADPTRPRRP